MKRALKSIILQYGMITLSCALYAVGFNWCFDPNHLSVGGFTGIAQIINYFLPQAPIGAVIVVIVGMLLSLITSLNMTVASIVTRNWLMADLKRWTKM